MKTEPIHWGILGPGKIAREFATDLQRLPDALLTGVGSRSRERAAAFAEEFGVTRTYGSYDALLADPEVQVIYIATPHPFHYQQTLDCLRAGKAVLCEKPLAINAQQVEELIACAREEGRFLMEAMWTRFLPVIQQVKDWLATDRIGKPRMLTADFGFRGAWQPEERWLNPELAGGALLDVGIYPITLAHLIFEQPLVDIRALAHLGRTNVDEQTGILLGYEDGALAVLSCAVRTATPGEARIDGTKGRIRIPQFWSATSALLEGEDEQPVHVSGKAGYHFQAKAVMNHLRSGELESPVMSWAKSLAVMRIMDEVRARIGLQYPMESVEKVL